MQRRDRVGWNEGDVVGWSTRQLAELASTTLRTIRHYHDVGLLAEPERRVNGYKSYGVTHLVRVLRIKRLTDLGLSLQHLDQVRQALGEPKASFLGYSYGTHLGAVYTTLFPNRTDRVVLDSSLPAKGWDVEGGRLFGRGMEERFPDFAKWAAARPELGLDATPQQVKAKYFDLAARLDKAPAQGIDGSTFRLLTFAFRYGDGSFPKVAEYWRALDTGQPTPPEDPAPDPGNAISSRLYTVCNDSRWPTSVGTYQRNVAIDRVRYPMFGAAAANIQPCAFWADPAEQPVRVGGQGPANVMIAQNDRDPATPLTGAKDMRRALGKRAVMVSADQGGHGAYVFAPNKCLNNAVTSFLLVGTRPARDLGCAAESAG